ncbi:MAG TPA: gliding motility protein GldM, partial [Cytophagaceae bacterium]
MQRMEEEVERRGNREDEVELMKKANLICERSKKEMEYLENLKRELIEKSGGIDEDGSLKGAKEETKVEEIMIGANKGGKAYELQNRLREYVRFMNQESTLNFSMLALDGNEDPVFENNPEQRNKDFAELNFGQTPLVASLAILSELQSRIASMQETTINTLAEKIGGLDFKFDVLKPVAKPAARIVAAGTKYEAQVFMSATSSTLKPEIKVEGKELVVDESGVGSLSFTASGGDYSPDGYVKKVWKGIIKMKKPDGKDTLYHIEEEYLVAKPVIQVRSASVQALYRNCGNKLNVQVPALGNEYKPTFTAEGATIIPGAERGMVTVVPTGASVKLKVSSNGNYLGEEKFNVLLIPNPTIEIKVNNKKVDPLKGIDKNELRSVSVRAVADKDFAKLLPDDAYFKVTEARVSLVANKKVKVNPKTFSNEFENISSWRDEANTGNYLLVEVLKVKRKNFRGEWEDVS